MARAELRNGFGTTVSASSVVASAAVRVVGATVDAGAYVPIGHGLVAVSWLVSSSLASTPL